MNKVYITISRKKIDRTLDLSDGVLLDRAKDQSIRGVEVLNVKEITINGYKVDLREYEDEE